MVSKNALLIFPLYEELFSNLINEKFVLDKYGGKVVELIAPKVVLDPSETFIDFLTRFSPRKYIEKETRWYDSKSLSIDLVNDVKIWNNVSDINEEINSNYGNLAFSRNNFSQFDNALQSLLSHNESRQAIIVYTRPSIHYEWNSHGASDFICTNYQQFFIRNNKLHCVTSMRSNDCWTGTFNDIPWFHLVIQRMMESLLGHGLEDLRYGDHIFIPNSFHCYEKHFDKLVELVNDTRKELDYE